MDDAKIISELLELQALTSITPTPKLIMQRYNVSYSKAKRLAYALRIALNVTSPEPKFDTLQRTTSHSSPIAILLLSDWHIGEVISQVDINQYNPNIAVTRVSDLLSTVYSELKRYNPSHLFIFVLGDMVSGRIHPELEFETPMHFQISLTSYLLLQIIRELGPDHVYCVAGNHGRMSRNKQTKPTGNNFDILTYLAIRNQFNLVTIFESGFGTIQLPNNKACFIAHGSYLTTSSPITVQRKHAFVQYTTYMKLNTIPDLVCIGHLHEPQTLSPVGSTTIVNGTLMGTNEYAWQKALYCKPCQKLLIIDDDCLREHTIWTMSVEESELPVEIQHLFS